MGKIRVLLLAWIEFNAHTSCLKSLVVVQWLHQVVGPKTLQNTRLWTHHILTCYWLLCGSIAGKPGVFQMGCDIKVWRMMQSFWKQHGFFVCGMTGVSQTCGATWPAVIWAKADWYKVRDILEWMIGLGLKKECHQGMECRVWVLTLCEWCKRWRWAT